MSEGGRAGDEAPVGLGSSFNGGTRRASGPPRGVAPCSGRCNGQLRRGNPLPRAPRLLSLGSGLVPEATRAQRPSPAPRLSRSVVALRVGLTTRALRPHQVSRGRDRAGTRA